MTRRAPLPRIGIEKEFVRRSCIKADSELGVPVMLMGMTMGHSKPLDECTVMSDTDSCSASGLPSICLTASSQLARMSRGRKVVKSTDVIRPAHFKKKIDIGYCAFRSASKSLPKLWSHMQRRDGIRQAKCRA